MIVKDTLSVNFLKIYKILCQRGTLMLNDEYTHLCFHKLFFKKYLGRGYEIIKFEKARMPKNKKYLIN